MQRLARHAIHKGITAAPQRRIIRRPASQIIQQVVGRWRRLQDLAAARRLAADVEWAAKRLPFTTKCLPQAMALSWLLRRRHLTHAIVIAVRPNQLRQSPDAMHAWVEVAGDKIIGDLPGPWIETLRLGS